MIDEIDNERVMAALSLARHDIRSALLEADVLYDPDVKLSANLELKSTMYSWAGNFYDAEEYINKSLSIDPQSLSNNYSAAMLHFKMKNFESSKQFFEKCLYIIDDTNREIYQETIFLHLGYCLIKSGDVVRAQSFLENCEPDRQTWLHGLTSPRHMLQDFQ